MNKESLESEKQKELESFREEIRKIKEEELRKEKEGEKFDPHWRIIDPSDLTEEDMEIWKKFKDDTLTPEDHEKYSESIGEYIKKKYGSVPNGKKEREERLKKVLKDSRVTFLAYLNNKLMPRWWKKEKE